MYESITNYSENRRPSALESSRALRSPGPSMSWTRSLPSATREPGPIPQRATQTLIALKVGDFLRRRSSLTPLVRVLQLDFEMRGEILHPEIEQAFKRTDQEGLSADEAWVVLAWWINTRPGGMEYSAVQDNLKPVMDTINPDLVARCLRIFTQCLGSLPVDS